MEPTKAQLDARNKADPSMARLNKIEADIEFLKGETANNYAANATNTERIAKLGQEIAKLVVPQINDGISKMEKRIKALETDVRELKLKSIEKSISFLKLLRK